MIRFILLLTLLCGCNTLKPSWINENAQETIETSDSDTVLGSDIGPTNGHFDEQGRWIPDDETIVATYKIPDIGGGFLFDARTFEVTPSIQVELFEVDTHIPYINRIKIDGGVGYQRAFIYVGKLITSIFEISIGRWAGWNFEDRQVSYGPAFTIIRF